MIYKRIDELCQQLKDKEPDSQWIVAWREYGITDSDSKFVSNDIKKYLKKSMQELTKKYPQLTIISGTVATKKHFNDYANKLSKVKKYYNDNKWLDKKESQLKSEHKLFHLSKIQKLQEFDSGQGIYVVRNTAYIFTNGECLARRDKIAPYLETSDLGNNWWKATSLEKTKDALKSDIVFQPGNKKNKSCHVFLKKNNSAPIDIAIEICREHIHQTLYEEDKNKKNPDIHFVLAYGGAINIENLHGNVCVFFDRNYAAQLIVGNEVSMVELQKFPYRLYHNNLLSNNAELRGPLLPVYLQETKVLAIFDELKLLFKKNDKYLSDLAALRELFCDLATAKKNVDYIELIEKMKSSTYFNSLMQVNSLNDKKGLEFSVKVNELFLKMFALIEKLEPKLYPDPDQVPVYKPITTKKTSNESIIKLSQLSKHQESKNKQSEVNLDYELKKPPRVL